MIDQILKINHYSLKKLLALLEVFLTNTQVRTKKSNFVLGLSGGIDSAVCAAILKHFDCQILLAIMPCENPCIDDAVSIAKHLDLDYFVFDLKIIYQKFLSNLEGRILVTDQAKINIKPRLRMTMLYALACLDNGLVVNTSNYSEHYLGYFTKFGDGVGDIALINYFYKSTVYNLGWFFELPSFLFSKPPSADLYQGQTDINEIGISSYDAVEDFLENKKVSNKDKKTIKKSHNSTHHKRQKILDLLSF